MAKALDVSSPYLSSIELGERTLTSNIADQAVEYFRKKRVGAEQLAELRIASDQSMTSVPVSMLQADKRNLVAAFARRLSDGNGVPDDVLKWLNGGDQDGSK
jgi:hypothetical protein